MLANKQLQAFSAVAKLQNFELAARHLHITQSAVSQRIRHLEEYVGQTLIVRTTPLRLTEAGFKVLQHVQKLELLENQLERDLNFEHKSGPINFTIGVNADSLSTWFWQALEPLLKTYHYTFDLVKADQDQTINLMKQGLTQAVVTTHPTPLQGAKSVYLGKMIYLLVASPAFIEQFFQKGVTKQTLKVAPTAIYDRDDDLTFDFMEKYFDVSQEHVPYHTFPSVESFERLVLADAGYALIPELQAARYLASGELISLAPEKTMPVPFYLHHWQLNNDELNHVIETITHAGRRLLIS
ncbi:LysR family transcriptional regulator ArgP [Pseudoalteromonas xiamenensis]